MLFYLIADGSKPKHHQHNGVEAMVRESTQIACKNLILQDYERYCFFFWAILKAVEGALHNVTTFWKVIT
jgi:hypothetical protein